MTEPPTFDDAIGFVRKHPEMFFSPHRSRSLSCAIHLVTEALALGGSDVRVFQAGPWWVVLSTTDWFGSVATHDMFHRIISFPRLGANSMQIEVVLRAFAESVATYNAAHGFELIVGDAPDESVKRSMTSSARAVAFAGTLALDPP